MSITADTLSSISVAALVTAMVMNDKQKSGYTLVVGLGMTGLSVVRHKVAQGEEVVVADTRNDPPGLAQLKKEYPDVEVYLGAFDAALFLGAAQIVLSPGVSLRETAVEQARSQGVDIVGDVELFSRQVNTPIIAVSGSNGKSTVVSLLGEMAKNASVNALVGGNIGVPVLELLKQPADLYILELSSFQLETLQSLKPVAAAVLNVSPDHMDRYASYEEYVKTKAHIYHNCKLAVINRDDQNVQAMQAGQSLVSGFTLGEPGIGDFGVRVFEGERWLCKGGKRLIKESQVKIQGLHNTANALAALALGEAVNFSMQDMLDTLKSFKGLPHRTQWVAEKDNVLWINDSKGTNVGATIAAIEGLPVKNRLLLIAGGVAKDADFQPLQTVVKDKVRSVVLIGRDAPIIEQSLQGVVPMLYAKDMHEAVKICADLAHPGDTVLLSPGCASFDMFSGYAQRGEVFVEEVEAL